MSKVRLSALLLALCAALPLGAQGYFGQNQVQFQKFSWRVLKTEHFDIHYYPEEAQVARMALAYLDVEHVLADSIEALSEQLARLAVEVGDRVSDGLLADVAWAKHASNSRVQHAVHSVHLDHFGCPNHLSAWMGKPRQSLRHTHQQQRCLGMVV